MQQGERKSKKENKLIVEKGKKESKDECGEKRKKKECVRKIHSVRKKVTRKNTEQEDWMLRNKHTNTHKKDKYK